MSWLGVNLNESLSSIKGQISNFTKEVLSDDASDSLVNAEKTNFQDGIETSLCNRQELEALVLQYKQKVNELRRHELDLEERLRASELEKNERNLHLQQELKVTQDELRHLKGRSQEWGWETSSDHNDQPSHQDKMEPKKNDPIEDCLAREREAHQREILALQETHRLQLQNLQKSLEESQAEKVLSGETSVSQASVEKSRDASPAQGADPTEEFHLQISYLKEELENAKTEKASLAKSLEELDAEHSINIEKILAKKNILADELSQIKAELDKVSQEKESYKEAAAGVSKELDNFKMKYAELEEEKEGKEIEKLSIEKTQLLSLSSDYEKILFQLAELQNTLKEKETQISNCNSNLNLISDQLAASKEENNQLKVIAAEYHSKKEELSSLLASQQNADKLDHSLQQEISRLTEEVGEDKKTIGALNDKILYKDEEILKHEAVFEEKCREHSEMYNRLMSTRHNFEMREKEILHEKNALIKEIEMLQSPQDAKQTNTSNDVIAKLTLQTNVQNAADLPKVWHELESELASLRCERDKMHDSFNSTEQELRGAQDLLEALEIEKNDIERECEDLRDQLEELQCGERQPPEGSLTPRSLPTIEEEESELSPSGGNEESLSDEEREQPKLSPLPKGSTGCVEKESSSQLETCGTHKESLSLVIAKDDKIQFLEDELNKHKSILIYKEDQIDQLMGSIKQINEIFGITNNDIRQTYVSIRQEYTSLLSRIDAKRSEVNELKKTNSDLEIANNVAKFKFEEVERSLLAQIAERNSMIEHGKSKVAKLHSENVGLNENLTLLLAERSHHADIELRYNKVVSENSQKEEEIKSLKAAKEELLKKFQNEAEEREKLTSQIEEMTSQHQDHLTSIRQEYESRISSLEGDGKSNADLMHTKDSQIESLQKRLEVLSMNSSEDEKLTGLLESSNKDKDRLEKQFKSSNDENLILKEENLKIKESLDKLTQNIKSLEKENKTLNEDQYKSSIELANLQQERQQMISTSTQKHQEAIAYYAEIQRLTHLFEQEKKNMTQEESRLKLENAELHKELEKFSRSSKDQDDVSKMQIKRMEDELRQEKSSCLLLREDFTKSSQELATLQKERDSLWKANSTFNEQYQDMSKELSLIKEKEKAASQECIRLKDHLKLVEENTVQEALQAEQRENSLRQTIAKLHEKMASHSNIYTSTNQKNTAQLETLQEELREVIHERDDARYRLSAAEEASLQYQESLTRLQQVLSDFQKSQGREIAHATDRENRKLEAEIHTNKELYSEISRLKNELLETQSKVESTAAFRADLLSKDDTIAALRSQVYSIQQAAKKSQEKVIALQSSSDAKVDKPLLRNLMVGYFATPSDQQKEVLRIIAEVLDFSPEERHRTGLDAQAGSWLSSIANFLAPPPSNIRVTSKVDVLDHSSLSQAFIRFLEEETTPRPRPRLPAVEMAKQATDKVEKKLQAVKNIPKTDSGTYPAVENKTSVSTSSPLLDTRLALNLPTFHTLPDDTINDKNASSITADAPVAASNTSVSSSADQALSTSNYLSSLLSPPKESESSQS